MSRIASAIIVFPLICVSASAQERRMDQDSTLNNLVHPPGYQSCALGTLGRVKKVGHGPRNMILIAGAGFGGEIYDDFMESRKDRYTMFAVTLPGFGGTAAPPMPPEGTSYGEQTWTRAAQQGVARLIDDEKLSGVIVVGHWIVATHVALGTALERPEQVAAAIIISGRAKTPQVGAQRGPTLTTPAQRARFVDAFLAPRWFKTVTRDTWDDNNFYPHDYARHPVRALQLWRQAYEPSLPVWVRYLCESWTQDATAKLRALRVPTLILKPGFDEDFYFDPDMDYMRAFCHDSWNGVEKLSEMISVRTIKDARVFIMDDQPEQLNASVEEFLRDVFKGPVAGDGTDQR